MLSGIFVGWLCNYWLVPADAARAADGFAVVTDVFLRLIKMIIAPLVLTTLITGVGHMEDAAAVGRIGAKTMAWFLTAAVTSLLLGLIMVELLKPGVGLTLRAVTSAAVVPTTDGFSLSALIAHLVPTSIIDAMAQTKSCRLSFSRFSRAPPSHYSTIRRLR